MSKILAAQCSDCLIGFLYESCEIYLLVSNSYGEYSMICNCCYDLRTIASIEHFRLQICPVSGCANEICRDGLCVECV